MKQLIVFLVVTEYYRIWIPGYGLDVKPLLKQSTETGPGVLSGFFLFWSLSAERQKGINIPMPGGCRKRHPLNLTQ